MLARDSVQIPKSDYEQLLHGSPLPTQQPPVMSPLLYEASPSVPSLPPQAMASQSAMAAFQCSPLSTCQSPFVAPQPSPFAACQASQPALQLRSPEAFQPAPPNTFQTSPPIAYQSFYANITQAPQPDASWPDCYLSSPQASGMSEHDDRHTPSSTTPDSICNVELGTADPIPEEEEDAAAEGSDARIVCMDDLLMLPAPTINFFDKYLGDADELCHQEDHHDSCTCEPSAASTWSCQLAPVQPHWSQHTVQDIVRHIAQVKTYPNNHLLCIVLWWQPVTGSLHYGSTFIQVQHGVVHCSLASLVCSSSLSWLSVVPGTWKSIPKAAACVSLGDVNMCSPLHLLASCCAKAVTHVRCFCCKDDSCLSGRDPEHTQCWSSS